ISVLATPASGVGDAFEVDDTAAQASEIAISGAPQTHSFHVGTDVDWVRFTLANASNVTIETDGVAGGSTELRLYGPDNSTTQIAYDHDSGNGNYSRIDRNNDK